MLQNSKDYIQLKIKVDWNCIPNRLHDCLKSIIWRVECTFTNYGMLIEILNIFRALITLETTGKSESEFGFIWMYGLWHYFDNLPLLDCNTTKAVMKYLNEIFANRWKANARPVGWQAKIPRYFCGTIIKKII